MDATELGRWTRFAAKGGIGKCTALQDCIAEQPEDLMFMKVSLEFSLARQPRTLGGARCMREGVVDESGNGSLTSVHVGR